MIVHLYNHRFRGNNLDKIMQLLYDKSLQE